jgi:hypothetical protein
VYRTPEEYGIPNWRSHVGYVPQRPATLPGTPIDFYQRVCSFAAQKQRLAALRASGPSPMASLIAKANANITPTQTSSTQPNNNNIKIETRLDPVSDITLIFCKN